MKNLNHLLLIVSEDDVWQIIFQVQKYIHKISVWKNQAVNESSIKMCQKHSKNWKQSTVSCHHLRCMICPIMVQSKNVKIVLVSWKQNQNIGTTKMKLVHTVATFTAFAELTNSKMRNIFLNYSTIEITFLEMRQIAINKYLATSSNDSWKAVHQKWRSFV